MRRSTGWRIVERMQTRVVAAAASEVCVREQGAGPPVLLLHGNPDTSAAWAGVIDALAPTFRCIAPDLPGFGASTAPEGFDYSLDGLVAFMEALYASLAIGEPVHVVGHDFGGLIAAAWISRFPQRAASVTLANAAFSSDYRWHFWAHVWRTPLLGEFSMLTTNKPLFVRELRRGSPRLTKAYLDDAYRAVTPQAKRAVLRLYRAVRRDSIAPWEAGFRRAAAQVPVLVLWGDGDPYIPGEFADRVHARKVVRFAGAGHWVQVVEPRRFADELRAFYGGENGTA